MMNGMVESSELFQTLDEKLASGTPAEAFDFLADQCLNEQNYALLFETRLMKKRWELGLPLIQTDGGALPGAESQKQYEQFMIDTAREIGGLFLASDQIERAWPYFRAIGETKPIIEALEKAEPGREDIEGVIEIAFQQGVHPVKGLELVLRQYGMCRAITLFGMYGVTNGKQACLTLITNALYDELAANLRYAIGQRESETPPADTPVIQLIQDRDWLFGEYDYYVDTSHLNSIVQYATDTDDKRTLGLIVEMCAYGAKLSNTLHLRGNPPFDQPFIDYAIYAQALLGENVDAAIQHFTRKMEEGDPGEIIPAQVLIQLLLKLGRIGEALQVSIDKLADVPPSHLSCPSTLQLAHLAKDYKRLRDLARSKQDALSYVAATFPPE
jgi:hypothetical protein